MCIAIYKPKNIRITREALYESYCSNRDGCGFAYVRPDIKEVCIEKGFFDFDEFYKEYQKYQDLQCIIHFRIATHKNVNGQNCHPWRVNDDLVFIHNGTISGMSDDDSLSDTGNFNNKILKPLMDKFADFYLTDQFKWSIENSIAKHNKLIFLDSSGNFQIINESVGYWDKGCWFSNKTYWCAKSGFCVVEGEPEKEVVRENIDKSANLALKEKSILSGIEIQTMLDKDKFVHITCSLPELDKQLAEANKVLFAK